MLDAALEVVGEGGVQGLSLREVAKRAGVSHAAPYHHFPTKDSLVAELADEGWALLADAARTAASSATPSTRIQAVVVAYVGFARDRPARFDVMRERDAARPNAGERSGAALVLFPILTAAIADVQAAGLAPQGDPTPLVLTTWAAMHGLAALLVNGPLSEQTAPETIEQLASVVAADLTSGWLARGQF